MRRSSPLEAVEHGAQPAAEIVAASGPGHRLGRAHERARGGVAEFDAPSVDGFGDCVGDPEQDRALADDVGAILGLEGRLEDVRRTERDGPAERDVGGASVDVLVHGDAAVDAGAVGVASLLVEAPHRCAHALRAHAQRPTRRREVVVRRRCRWASK